VGISSALVRLPVGKGISERIGDLLASFPTSGATAVCGWFLWPAWEQTGHLV